MTVISATAATTALSSLPLGPAKGELHPKDLLLVNLDGIVVEGTGKPSSETALHLTIYRKRQDVHAIIHAHPVTATALTVAGISFAADIVTEGAMVLGDVPTVPYAPPGSLELAEGCGAAAETASVFLMERHGAVTVGADLTEASTVSIRWKPWLRCTAIL